MTQKIETEDGKEHEMPVVELTKPEPEIPQKPRKQRSDKGAKRGKRSKKEDLKIIPLAVSFQILSNALAQATNKPAFKMSKQEADACEHGCNEFAKYKFEDIEKAYPYIIVATPFLAYFGRVAIELGKQAKITLPKKTEKDTTIKKLDPVTEELKKAEKEAQENITSGDVPSYKERAIQEQKTAQV